eukprot:gene1411-12031_t
MSTLPSRKLLVKVIILGDSSVGKTSLLHQFAHKEFVSQKASVCDSFLKQDLMVGDNMVNMQIWDTAGQERFNSISKSYFRGSDACVIVFDVTDSNSFNNLSAWRKKFMEETDANESFPFIIVGNKIDLKEQRVISKEKALKWCKEHGDLEYFETSAKDATNVENCFQELAKHAADTTSENKALSDIPSDLGAPPPSTEEQGGCAC